MSPNNHIVAQTGLPEGNVSFEQILELHGPRLEAGGRVHYSRGMHLPVQSFEEFNNRVDAPPRGQRAPEQEQGWHTDTASLRRAVALLGDIDTTDPEVLEILREIRWRILVVNEHAEHGI